MVTGAHDGISQKTLVFPQNHCPECQARQSLTLWRKMSPAVGEGLKPLQFPNVRGWVTMGWHPLAQGRSRETLPHVHEWSGGTSHYLDGTDLMLRAIAPLPIGG